MSLEKRILKAVFSGHLRYYSHGLIMSVIVTPLGVIAAIYLHEYAGKNALTRLTRIAVINLLAPSIVYGVFGLGFFVYFRWLYR